MAIFSVKKKVKKLPKFVILPCTHPNPIVPQQELIPGINAGDTLEVQAKESESIITDPTKHGFDVVVEDLEDKKPLRCCSL